MDDLSKIISREVGCAGPLSFARFMELALYIPQLGYYERNKQIGCRGDFYTSVSAGPLFGELLAVRFLQWLEPLLPTSHAFQILEAGAHEGQLAGDVLAALKRLSPEVFRRLQYWIVEPSPIRQSWQREYLDGFVENVRWFESWQETPPVCGVIFSNELLDAMPVRRFYWNGQETAWREWLVDWDGQRFCWKRGDRPPEAGLSLPLIPEELARVLPDGFSVEVSSAAVAWWKEAAQRLQQGKLVALDYGCEENELLRPERFNGTVRAYFHHRLSENVLERPGEQDITAHVNFTAIRRAGEAAGLKSEEIISQSQFLTEAVSLLMKNPEAATEWTAAKSRQFQTLAHPDHLGRAFRVLVQSRD